MKGPIMLPRVFSWIFGTAVFVVGVLNIILLHPIPGIAYLFLSFIYFPPANTLLSQSVGFQIPLLVKIILAIAIIMFTLGVSDLGDMID